MYDTTTTYALFISSENLDLKPAFARVNKTDFYLSQISPPVVARPDATRCETYSIMHSFAIGPPKKNLPLLHQNFQDVMQIIEKVAEFVLRYMIYY